jgi:cytochrome d ubiquinol oxidase subunit I
VAISSNLSALWILIANGWMQHPVGYVINEVTGRAELVDFFALMTNPKGWIFFWHTISAGLATASFMILGVSAYHLFRKQYLEVFKPSFQMAALVGLIASVLVFLGGHTQGQYVYETQPMKMAAIEAMWWSEKPASFSIITIGDLTGKQLVWELRIPKLLSLIACNNFTCQVTGVNDLQYQYTRRYGPGDYIPLIVVTYWSFRFMMTVGLIMMLLSFLFLLATRKQYENAKWMKWVPWVIALPYIGNTSGWILTEMGRQPWIVQGLLKVEQGVSPNLTTLDLLISLIGYIVVYGSLGVAMVYLMKKYATAGPDAALHESVDVEPESSGVGDILPIGAQD